MLPALSGTPDVVAADALVPLGPIGSTATALFDLGRATLRVLRPRDLLSLTYRLPGLLLQMTPNGAARVLPSRGGPVCRGGAASDPHPAQDLRPIMLVEFPPQHVAERAYTWVFNGPPQITEPAPADKAATASVPASDPSDHAVHVPPGR